ncbi:MAG: oligosaccharide flippase family protein [Candidatus Tectomicrobia bacterium]|nr:oligosaccharide flippase family protein [Candidatus Tectomicrobia bacterium]
MYPLLKGFFKHSMIYTMGNIIYRGASFLLIPLYTHYLEPSEYGMLEIFYVTSAVFQTLFASGISHAALRFYFEYNQPEEKNAVISTSMIASFVFPLLGVLVLFFFAPLFSYFFFKTQSYALPFRLVFFTLVLEISREVSLAFIRAKERSTFFVVISFIQLILQVSANVYAVVFLQLGVLGIVGGNLFATFSLWVILTGFTIYSCGIHFDWSKLWLIMKYGNPLMLSSLTVSTLKSMDRYLLNAYTGLNAIGMYALGLRVAQIIPILILDPFTKSFGPFRFSIMEQDRAKEVFAQVLRYYLFLSGWVTLGLCIFSQEIIQLVSSPKYWNAYQVVPLLLVQFLFGGIHYCFQTGLYIQKRTNYVFYITLVSGLLNLGLDLALIPRWGIYGAAGANGLNALCAVFLAYVVSQRIYPVNYDLRGMAKILLTVGVIGLIAFQVHFDSLWWTVFVKLLLLGSFPVLLGILHGYTPGEIRKMEAVWRAGAA